MQSNPGSQPQANPPGVHAPQPQQPPHLPTGHPLPPHPPQPMQIQPAQQQQQSQQLSQQQQQHLMSQLMQQAATNPAAAAAMATGSPLFPSFALLSNPGAALFNLQPEAFGVAMQQQAAAVAAAAVAHNNNNHNNGTTTNPTTTTTTTTTTGTTVTTANNHHTAAAAAAGTTVSNGGGGGTTGNTSQQQQQQQQLQATASSLFGTGPILPTAPVSSAIPTLTTTTNNTSGDTHTAQHTLSLPQNSNNNNNNNNAKSLSAADRAQQNRDRNREHARSTRLRKKAYVQKLKELVEGLHAERTEEVRQRRVQIQHLAEQQTVRRSVVRTFLRYHARFETDVRKWGCILEDDFGLQQPVTPYRSFRRQEIVKECRISKGVDAIVCDAASVAVMIEGIGSRGSRWVQIKRDEFKTLEARHRASRINHGAKAAAADGTATTTTKPYSMPSCLERQESRLQHAVSSLSSSSDSSNNAKGNDTNGRPTQASKSKGTSKRKKQVKEGTMVGPESIATGLEESNNCSAVGPTTSNGVATASGTNNNGSSSSSSNNTNNNNAAATSSPPGNGVDGIVVVPPPPQVSSSSRSGNSSSEAGSKDFHDYHDTKPLPDPKLGYSERSSGSSPSESNEDSSGSNNNDDDNNNSNNKKKNGNHANNLNNNNNGSKRPVSTDSSSGDDSEPRAKRSKNVSSTLPPNIAKTGGIPHNIRPVETAGAASRLLSAPAVELPPFAGIGKRSSTTISSSHKGVGTAIAAKLDDTASRVTKPTVISADFGGSSSSDDGNQTPQIRGCYHINEDDMILMEDVLMCPFIFRSQDAVLCGAFCETVMPGMLRAHFSSRNKLQSLELVYDAMGYMQQLERASGNEGSAQIIAGSLEMALAPNATEAGVITLAQPPYLIVNVNEVWTRMTGYTQMEVEGKEYLGLMEGDATVPGAKDRAGKPAHQLEEVARGRPACSTNIHYDSDNRDFLEFVCSYPLTNASDEITHILHVSKELPSFSNSGALSPTV